ncbi:hypothetical protein R5R35_012963 [Gryllus longicercus]|uniref:Endonuclease/exonuclease/phosphatase family domain-containing protein 1 n=1 Tax=Gryllus longicercus TaxID=2509291 RepID=A0AAN9WSA4_9ORTH
MGQSSSAPIGARGGRRKSLRDTWRSPFPRRSQTHQGALSATFHFVDDDKHVEQLNVNTASEEELMTLPGITRSVAQSIVEYRQVIGGFRKVEDLALVSGIGAEKLDLIRPEICVRRRNASCTSSRAPSCDSLPNSEVGSGRLGGSGKVVNVNTGNVFDLMLLHGMTQELAANVVHHRERRGPFRTIDDLLKVKGITPLRLSALRSQLCVTNNEEPVSRNGLAINHVSNGKIPVHRKALPGTIKPPALTNGCVVVDDIFELLSAKSLRPVVDDDFQYKRAGRPAARLASWNLQELSQEKVENPGVREVVCRTLLENRFSVLAVQEVQDGLALSKLCGELNSPSLRRVADWRGNSRQWKIALPNDHAGLGFLFDAGQGVQLTLLQTLQLTNNEYGLAALLATFQVDELYIALVNVHAKDCNAESIRRLEQAVKTQMKPCDPLLILGDFTGTTPSRELDELQSGLQYRPVVPVAMSTLNSDTNSTNNITDNIFLNAEAQLQFTGIWGVVQQGLTHLAIPQGWMWGGAVSIHCPVWCELFTHSILAEGGNADGCE